MVAICLLRKRHFQASEAIRSLRATSVYSCREGTCYTAKIAGVSG